MFTVASGTAILTTNLTTLGDGLSSYLSIVLPVVIGLGLMFYFIRYVIRKVGAGRTKLR